MPYARQTDCLCGCARTTRRHIVANGGYKQRFYGLAMAANGLIEALTAGPTKKCADAAFPLGGQAGNLPNIILHVAADDNDAHRESLN